LANLPHYLKTLYFYNSKVKGKVKPSRYRPGQARMVPGVLGSLISRKIYMIWSGCQPYAPGAFNPQEIFLVLIPDRSRVIPRAIV
jgi:hypothetical protein